MVCYSSRTLWHSNNFLTKNKISSPIKILFRTVIIGANGDNKNNKMRRTKDLCVAHISKLASSPASSAVTPIVFDTPHNLPTFVAGTPTSNMIDVAQRGSLLTPDYVVINTVCLVLCNNKSFTDNDGEQKTQVLFVFCLFMLCLSAFVACTHTNTREQ